MWIAYDDLYRQVKQSLPTQGLQPADLSDTCISVCVCSCR
jgi:hypothetical protein